MFVVTSSTALGARRGGRKAVTLVAVALLIAFTLGAPASVDANDDADADDTDAELPPSEDVPLHTFEVTVVTVGKASGKEKRVQKPAFFLRGDDAAAAATRFIYLHTLPLDHAAHFKQVFQMEWEEKVPEEIKPRQKTRRSRSKPMGPLAYLERGKEHAAAGRDDEAHFDYVRAYTGEGQFDPEIQQSQRLQTQQLEEAMDLLRQHHRKHSRALIAADKAREIKAVAHEREVKVLEERKANKARRAEDTADFKEACEKAGWRSGRRKVDAAAAAAAPAPLHKLALSLNRGDGKAKADVTAVIEAGEDAALAAVHFCAEHGLSAPDQVLQLGLDVHKSAETAGVAVPKLAPADQAADPVGACMTTAAEKLEGSDDDGGGAAALLVRAWIHGGYSRGDEVKNKIRADLGVAMRMYVHYRAMYGAVEDEDWEKVVEHATEGDKVVPKRKPDALRKLAVARAHWALGQLTAGPCTDTGCQRPPRRLFTRAT